MHAPYGLDEVQAEVVQVAGARVLEGGVVPRGHEDEAQGVVEAAGALASELNDAEVTGGGGEADSTDGGHGVKLLLEAGGSGLVRLVRVDSDAADTDRGSAVRRDGGSKGAVDHGALTGVFNPPLCIGQDAAAQDHHVVGAGLAAQHLFQGLDEVAEGGGDDRGDRRDHWQVPAGADDQVAVVSSLHGVLHELQRQRREEGDQQESKESKHD